MSTPLPDPRLPFAEQDPCILLACGILGEVANQPFDAMVGIACVARNRVNLQGWMGQNYTEVLLKPYQFDCFLPNDPNYKKLLHPLSYETSLTWEKCYLAAYRVFYDAQPDTTYGALYYYTFPLKGPPRKKDGSPAWGPTDTAVVIAGVTFCRPAKPVPGLPQLATVSSTTA